jgi:tellurite methyltransferase
MPAADRKKWDAKYTGADAVPREPSAVLVSMAKYLPPVGRALDVAGGAGRHAIWLAQRGLNVTIADVSPVGLALTKKWATAAGVTIATLQVDLEEEAVQAVPFDLIISLCYLWRPNLISQVPRLLAPGGKLVMIQPTKRNLERHEKPPADYLVEEGQLKRLFPSLEIVHYEEGWLADGRHDAVLVARKPEPRVV